MGVLLLGLIVVQDAVDRAEFEKMKKELAELRKKVEAQEGKKADDGAPAGQDLPTKAQDKRANPIYSRMSRFTRKVYLGGYIDLEYVNKENSKDDTFDQHRFVPFFYADISDQIKLAVELEIEHGNEVGIEFATVDYVFADWIGLRAGIILDPVGKFNLVHDAPYQDLTQRPLVDLLVIPAVLREPGIGLFGRFDADPWQFSYEFYVTNGFTGLDDAGTAKIDKSKGLKDARGSSGKLGDKYRDFNNNKAVVGRCAVSPFLGLEVGASFHYGTYDERSDNNLGLYAVDLTISGGGLYNALIGSGAEFLRSLLFAIEIVGEFAYADIERDAFAQAAGVPDDFRGFYVEFRYHFMFDFVKKNVPGAGDESTFTLVFRWDQVDLDGDKRRGATVGFNFRPREDTVFKFEYSFNREGGGLSETDNDVFAFSVATYF